MWPGYQSGPNERKVEMWAFGHTKQSIILRNPFLGIYVGSHWARAWEEEQGMPVRLGQRFLFSLYSPGLPEIPGKDQGLFFSSEVCLDEVPDLTVLV